MLIVALLCTNGTEGCGNVADHDRPGRLISTSVIDSNIEQMKQIIRIDRQLSMMEVADEVGRSFEFKQQHSCRNKHIPL